MSITIKKTNEVIVAETLDILHEHFITNGLTKVSANKSWYGTDLMPQTFFAKLLRLDPEHTLHGIIKSIDPENKKVKISSYRKSFLEVCMKLEKKLPDYKIIITELFE